MINKQQNINKMLKNMKCSYSPYNTYGKWLKLDLYQTLILLDIVVPSFKLITLVALKLKRILQKIEVCRITLNNK